MLPRTVSPNRNVSSNTVADAAPQFLEPQLAHVDPADHHPARRRGRRSARAARRPLTCPSPVAPTRASDVPSGIVSDSPSRIGRSSPYAKRTSSKRTSLRAGNARGDDVLDDGRRSLEHVDDATCGRGAALHRAHALTDRAQREDEQHEVDVEEREVPIVIPPESTRLRRTRARRAPRRAAALRVPAGTPRRRRRRGARSRPRGRSGHGSARTVPHRRRVPSRRGCRRSSPPRARSALRALPGSPSSARSSGASSGRSRR